MRSWTATAAGWVAAALVTACSGGGDEGGGAGGASATSGGGSGGRPSSIGGGTGWPDGGGTTSGGSAGVASGGSAGGSASPGFGGTPTGSGGATQGPSCGELAQQSGWASASCEWNGNGACGGRGTPTYDCDFCCEAGGSGGSDGTGGSTSSGTGFGYPVGDKTTAPAGGWQVWQVLGHYWADWGGRHLAQDVSVSGGVGANRAPVYSVADGVVRYAKPNSSSYRNVILIEHEVGDGTQVCSFYGHITTPMVNAGDRVTRGQQISTVLPWSQACTGCSDSNTHLHYVLVTKPLCDKAALSGATSGGSSICGYDGGGPSSVGWSDLSTEPYSYTTVSDPCGNDGFTNGFISPSKFIQDHHF
jgi:hypothetical protein